MRNVVVICLDSVRRDYFKKHANRLQKLSDAHLPQCRSASSWTVPSHASLLSGELPSEHGVHTGNIDFGTLSRENTVMGDLNNHKSILVSSNPYLGSPFNMDELFDEVVNTHPGSVFTEAMNLQHEFDTDRKGWGKIIDYLKTSVSHPHPVKSIVNGMAMKIDQLSRGRPFPNLLDRGGHAVSEAVDEVTMQTEDPYFLLVNYMDAHGPLWPHIHFDRSQHSVETKWSSQKYSIWDINTTKTLSKHEDYLQKYRDLYGAAIDYLDRIVADTVNNILENSDRDTSIIITADHGENLGLESDGGCFEHKGSLSEGVLHVPCLFIGTDPIDSGQCVSHLDFRSMISDLVTGTSPDITRNSIAAEVIGLGNADPDVRNKEYWHRMIRCAYQNGEKVIWDSVGEKQLYKLDISKPSWQQFEKSLDTVPEWGVEKFNAPIQDYHDTVKSRSEPDLDESTKQQLDDLGYT